MSTRAVATLDGRSVDSPWFDSEEAAAYLRLDSIHALHLAHRRVGIPAYRFKGGRDLRFRKEDLDAALERTRAITDDEGAGQARPKSTLAIASHARAGFGEGNRKGRR